MLFSVFLLLNLSVCKAQNINPSTGQLDPTQVYSTPNLVIPTLSGGPSPWVNGVYQDSLTCWGWGNPGYCGPNPIVRPDGNINFSFGMTDLYQAQAIASVLPNTGTGLRVNGYNFGFNAKNGNGWDDGRTDYLIAYTTFYGSNGSVAYNKSYNLNYQFNWTTFNFSETFTTPYASKDLSTVRYGFIGMDNNYWAGPYGPEINNVNFSLKYSVDPCYVNVLSSPTCPGYFQELAKLNTTTTTSTTPTTTTTSSGTQIVEPITQTVIAPTTTIETPTTSSVIQPVISATASVSTTPSPTVNNPQPKVGEVTQSSSPKPAVSTSTILGIIANENSRLASVERNAVEATTLQANAAALSAVQQAESVSKNLTTSSLNPNSSSSNSTQSFGTGISSQSLSIGLSIQSGRTQSSLNDPTQNIIMGNIGGSNDSNMRKNDFGSNDSKTEPQKSSVNQKARDNDAAGSVTLASIAKQPIGFEMYMTGMRDNAFYAPKEIYKGQNNVDNVRLMRGLSGGSDRLHEEMIKQQYK